MDLDALLADREGDSPSGENLDYDFDFMELQRIASPGEEKQMGSTIVAAEEPDFKAVEGSALSVLERAHDIRVAVILGEARLNTKGLAGFADVTTYIRRLVEERWETCHPELDADDDNDPTMRINAIRDLVNPARTMKYIRRVPLANSRTFGRASILQIQQAYGEVPMGEDQVAEFNRSSIGAAFQDTDAEVLAKTLEAARTILADLKAIDRKVMDAAPGAGVDLGDLQKLAQAMVRHMGEFAAGEAPEAAVEEEEEAPAFAGAAQNRGTPSRGGAPGTIESAADARAALDRVIDYFKRYEPSSPVPIILERAKRLVGADFLTIIKDMAPEGMEMVRTVGGLKDEDDD
ncbi:type VI secretion system protein TssA [Stagnihabitans tardus]|uniref:Type VI secretion system protein TssA n=1 Tax=Stagnihabitans tardus TaxID=2699202 RepID=A0AAE4YA61_9RHOB|nr:type VI secretion system protein TssA [Stagnihabitans tardus]NBZ88816.1 type VI secretion system protein TssA [Stagnihabitans tardus]